VRLSVTTWSFPACDLPESVAIAAALGFDAIDLGYIHRPAIDKRRVVVDAERYGAEMGALGLPVTCLFHRFGHSRTARNLADASSREANLRDFRAVLRFCTAAGVPLVMLLPGMVNDGQTRDAAIAVAANQLRAMVDLAAGANIIVAIEPHVGAATDAPEAVIEIVTEVPGLRLVLDPAHFICEGFSQASLEPLLPHAAHIHLRQARPGVLQTPLDNGTIDFGALLSGLRAVGYDGAVAVEYVHQDWMGTLHEDVLTETVRMRDLVREWGHA
jgi:sugar phosphate isomerase/epimerase